jgi:hypothetical protein
VRQVEAWRAQANIGLFKNVGQGRADIIKFKYVGLGVGRHT